MSAAVVVAYNRRQRSAAEDILTHAKREADTIRKQALISAREEWAQKENRRKEDLRRREKKLQQREQQIRGRETEIRAQAKAAHDLEMETKLRLKELDHREEEQEQLKIELKQRIDEQVDRLTSIAGLTMDEARREVLEIATERFEQEAAEQVAEIKNRARETASREAREIIITAIEKQAADTAGEATIKEVEIPNNRIKGMIIGREGRNIKSFEQITGAKMIVDETPDTIVLSCFDPVRREIARIALEALIKSRNFSPKTIQEAVAKATRQVDGVMNEAAGKVLRELKLNVHPDLKRNAGAACAIVPVTVRTCWITAAKWRALREPWAAELGLDVMLAKRAGLLHDVGKAESNGSERSHVAIGVEVTKRVREHPIVINSVMAHHNEAPPIDPISELVTAADIISSARPGSRPRQCGQLHQARGEAGIHRRGFSRRASCLRPLCWPRNPHRCRIRENQRQHG